MFIYILKFEQSSHPDLPAQGRFFLLFLFVRGVKNLFGFEKEWQRKRRMISMISLNKLGFDANDLSVIKITNITKYYLGLLNIYLNLLKHGKKDISS